MIETMLLSIKYFVTFSVYAPSLEYVTLFGTK